jgi:DNA repair ATPase RecN
MSAKTPLERVEEDERLLEQLMLAIPGFRGYKMREQRREADRIVRDHVYEVLQRSRDDLMQCMQRLSDFRITELMEPLNRLLAKIDRVSEKVNRASYGYSGFFDSVRIDVPQLNQMLAYDSQIMDLARKFQDSTSNFKTSLIQKKLEDSRSQEQNLEESITQLESAFDKRRSIIEGIVI